MSITTFIVVWSWLFFVGNTPESVKVYVAATVQQSHINDMAAILEDEYESIVLQKIEQYTVSKQLLLKTESEPGLFNDKEPHPT